MPRPPTPLSTIQNSPLMRFAAPYWRAAPGTPFTHISMDGVYGGMLHVPPGLDDEYRRAYSASLAGQCKMFMVECKTDVFCFFLDLDLELQANTNSLAGVPRHTILFVILQTVRRFFPKDERASRFVMVVADTTADQVRMERERSAMARELTRAERASFRLELDGHPAAVRSKEGEAPMGFALPSAAALHAKGANMHLHFPNMPVTLEMAVTMAMACAHALELFIGPQSAYLPDAKWSKAVDVNMYYGSGLRALGSRKCTKCPKCRGACCAHCFGSGKVDCGRAYGVVRVMRANGDVDTKLLQKLRDNVHVAVLATSIRTANAACANWRKYPNCVGANPDVQRKAQAYLDKVKDADATPREKMHKLTRYDARVHKMATETGPALRGDTENLPLDGPQARAALRAIRRFHRNYARLVLRKVRKSVRKYYVVVSGDGSHFCHNLPAGQVHRSNRIHFAITRLGVVQRCYSQNNHAKGLDGPCLKFSSVTKPLLSREVALLFPTAATQVIRGEKEALEAMWRQATGAEPPAKKARKVQYR